LTDLTIRQYRPADQDAVHRIAADTAFFGEPVERFLDDRRLFVDIVYADYTENEPEHIWLAVDGDEVAGFILGSTDTAAQQRRMAQEVLPRILKGDYRVGPMTRRYLWDTLVGVARQDRAAVDLRIYPAHLHINLDDRWRGRGGGRLLLEAYLADMRQCGVPGVHLHTTDHNPAACRLYERAGFVLLDARPTRVWSRFVAEPVENRSYGLLLAP
jgi:ribosomal protein S18 acetylase RimI-like enzyme